MIAEKPRKIKVFQRWASKKGIRFRVRTLQPLGYISKFMLYPWSRPADQFSRWKSLSLIHIALCMVLCFAGCSSNHDEGNLKDNLVNGFNNCCLLYTSITLFNSNIDCAAICIMVYAVLYQITDSSFYQIFICIYDKMCIRDSGNTVYSGKLRPYVQR